MNELPKIFIKLMFIFTEIILNSKQKYSPDTTETFKTEYDFIVVGAGSGGATVAARLAEMPCINVLLLEAGDSPPAISEVPGLARILPRSQIDWGYNTVPQKHAGDGLINRQLAYPLGKVIGGSSVLNVMFYVRGDRRIYDDWEANGATGWSYENVLPYFKKSENNKNPESVEKDYHGFCGPMSVEKPRFENGYKSSIKAAMVELGFHDTDVNGRYSKGPYDYQTNSIDGQRCSVAKAYLVPAEKKENLHIVKNALVTKVILKNKKAIGVLVDYQNKTFRIRATREVILSAGAVKTAQLLMLSGIGPKEHLHEMNIPLVEDLPVGQNLQDHPASFANYYTNKMPPVLEKLVNPLSIISYALQRNGIYASASELQYLMFGTNDRNASIDALPDYQLYFVDANQQFHSYLTNIKPELIDALYGPYTLKSQLWCASQLLHPKSRGTIKLRSNNPYDSPLIDPNYYENPQDLRDVVEGMKECDRVVNTKAMKELGVRPFETIVPGCESYKGNEDDYLTCVAKTIIITIFHPVGTAKMGNPEDPTTVVDPKLRVKGIESLRVVDASVMPTITNGNTNNPVIMIGEKAADMIKEDIHC